MSTYFVEFTAYVNERIRPENFPHEVKIQETFENIENTFHLQARVNQRFIELVTQTGLIALKNPDEPLEQGRITFDRRMYVNWNILTHMTVSVKLINEPSRYQEPLIPTSSKVVSDETVQ